MTTAVVVRSEPMIRTQHKGDGYTMWTLAEAKELHANLGKAIAEIEQTSRRLRVTWADDAIKTTLSVFLDWRDGNIREVARNSQAIAVAIDCLRSVIGDESDNAAVQA